jgi:hypothetical protein
MNSNLKNPSLGTDEKFYSLGYEAALHAKYRCMEYHQIMSEMQSDIEELKERYPGVDFEKAYIKGFEQGRARDEANCEDAEASRSKPKSSPE